MKLTVFFLSIVMLVSLNSCSGSSNSTEEPGGKKSPQLLLVGDATACTEDADCIVVELGCCDHCNGGHVASVNKEYKDEFVEQFADECDDTLVCTQKACAPQLPECVEGACFHYTGDM